jgi:tetratricopeptide (TPR) repeat protein
MGQQSRSVADRPFSLKAKPPWVAGAIVLIAAVAPVVYFFTPRLSSPQPVHLFTQSIPAPPAGDEQFQINRILGQLQSTDPQQFASGVQILRQIAPSRPQMLADGLPKWLPYLLDARQFDDVQTLTAAAIDEKPQSMPAVSDEQRARVVALLAQGKFTQALPEAKSYFNVSLLKDTSDAMDLLRQAQANSPTPAKLDTIVVGDAQYELTISRLQFRKDSYGTCVGLGNVLLLADRPLEAQDCFQRACQLCAQDDKKLQICLEGIARSLRAQTDNPTTANAFITALQHGNTPKLVGWVYSPTIQRVAQQIALADTPEANEPALELTRQQTDSGPPVQIQTGFECSTPLVATSVSPTHIVIRLTTPVYRDWFMFKIHGVANRAIRIDIKNDSGMLEKWWSLNPVYNDSTPALTQATKAWNGAELPDTANQDWHFIPNAWMVDSSTYSFVQKFSGNDATIAMRIPYTPTDNEAYFNSLSPNPLAKVIQIGLSQQNRPLLLLQIGQGDSLKQKPCILIYAGEHADEHDAMWAARGAIEYLLSPDPSAADLRHRFNWLIIPMLDPDSSYVSRHEGIIISFLMAQKTLESIAYANWFAAWANAGNRLDVVFDLHNRQSHEGTDVEAALLERQGIRGDASMHLHEILIDQVSTAGYTSALRPMEWGWSPDRLGGWLSRRFAPITLAYELNSQDPTRHLNLKQTKNLGTVFVNSAGDFLSTPLGAAVLADIDRRRASRAWQIAHYTPQSKNEDAIVSETNRTQIPLPSSPAVLAADENWVP